MDNEKCDKFSQDVLALAIDRHMTNGEFVSTVIALTFNFMCISLGAQTQPAMREVAVSTRDIVVKSFDTIIEGLTQ